MTIADHRTDYSQSYILPSLLTINSLVLQTQNMILDNFISNLSESERINLHIKMYELVPALFPLTQTKPQSAPGSFHDLPQNQKSALQAFMNKSGLNLASTFGSSILVVNTCNDKFSSNIFLLTLPNFSVLNYIMYFY